MNSGSQAYILLFLSISLFCLAGCSERVSEKLVRETEDPIFRRAKEMLERGLPPEALINFGKLIIKRNGDAPESHLEAGLIYLNHINDPISAYYHFSSYKTIVSREEESDLRESSIARVDELLKSAQKELLAQFPSEVYKDPLERIKLLDTIEDLRSENNQLKDALNASRIKLRELSMTPQRVGDQSILVDSAPREEIQTPAPAIEAAPREPEVRFYTVQAEDTLYEISGKMYGDSGRWTEILEANKAILPSASRLQPGMRLKIP